MNTNGTVKAKQKINQTNGGFTGLLEDGDEPAGPRQPRRPRRHGVLGRGPGAGRRRRPDRGAIWVLNLKKTGSIVKSQSKISATWRLHRHAGQQGPLRRSICALATSTATARATCASAPAGRRWLPTRARSGTCLERRRLGEGPPEDQPDSAASRARWT
jgi:hypothetical protein